MLKLLFCFVDEMRLVSVFSFIFGIHTCVHLDIVLLSILVAVFAVVKYEDLSAIVKTAPTGPERGRLSQLFAIYTTLRGMFLFIFCVY